MIREKQKQKQKQLSYGNSSEANKEHEAANGVTEGTQKDDTGCNCPVSCSQACTPNEVHLQLLIIV